MRVVRLTGFEQGSDFREAWNQLVDKNPGLTVFQRPEWLEAWWRVFGQPREAYLLAVYEDNRLVCVIPWRIKTLRLAGKKIKSLQFLADDILPECRWIMDPLLGAEINQAVLDYLQAHQADWDIIDLRGLPGQDGNGIKTALAGREIPWQANADGRKYILPLADAPWDQYFGSLNADSKKLFLHQERVLRQVKTRRVSGSEITREILEQIKTLNGRNSPTLDITQSQLREIYFEQILRGSWRDFAYFTLFYLKDELICYHVGFDDRGCITECDSGFAGHFSGCFLNEYMLLKHVEYALATRHSSIHIAHAEHAACRRLGANVQVTQELIIYRTRWLKSLHLSLRCLDRATQSKYSHWFGFLKKMPGRIANVVRDLNQQSAELHISVPRFLWRRLKKLKLFFFFREDYYRMVSPANKVSRPALPAPSYKDMVVRELTLEDYSGMEPLVRKQDLPARIQRFWELDQCWGAVLGNQVIGYFWITDHDHLEANSRTYLKVLPGEVYMYDAGVVPAHKHKGVMFYIMNQFVSQWLRHQECLIFALVLVSNHIPTKMFLRYNFEPVLLFQRRRWFGINWHGWKPLPESMIRALPRVRKPNCGAAPAK